MVTVEEIYKREAPLARSRVGRRCRPDLSEGRRKIEMAMV
jgi:hypothetical protein